MRVRSDFQGAVHTDGGWWTVHAVDVETPDAPTLPCRSAALPQVDPEGASTPGEWLSASSS